MTPRLLGVVLAVLLVAVACTEAEPLETTTTLSTAQCAEVAEGLVRDARSYVALFDEVLVSDLTSPDLPPVAELDRQVSLTRIQAIIDGCDTGPFDEVLAAGIDQLTGVGPVGRRVALSLRNIDPSSIPATNLTITPDDDLAGVLLEAGPNSTITLQAGEYNLDELILLDRPITIQGEGRSDTIIRSSAAGAAALIVGTGDFRLANLTLEHIGDEIASVLVSNNGSLTADNVRLAGAVGDPTTSVDGHGIAIVHQQDAPTLRHTTLRNLLVEGNTGIGVAVIGPGALTIEASTSRSNGFCGICFIEGQDGTGQITDVTVAGNELGIGATGSADVTIETSRILDNTTVGVLIEDEASVTIRSATIWNNGETGIEALEQSTATLAESTVSGHRRGAAVGDNATAILEDNWFDTNEAGIVLGGSASAEVNGNEFAGASNVAIAALDTVTGTIAGNRFTNPLMGIQLSDAANLTIEGNELIGTGTIGLLAADTASGTVANNHFSGHGIAIQLGGTATTRITDNTLDSDLGTGILATDSTTSEVSNNDLAGYELGYQVAGTARPSITGGSVTDAAGAGALYLESGAGTLTGAAFSGVDVGVMIAGDATPDLADLTISGSATAGLVYREAAGGTARRIVVSLVAQIGIQVVGSAAPSIAEVELSGGLATGLLAAGTSRPTLTASSITATLPIQVAERARPSISGTTIRSSGPNGVEFNGESAGTFERNDVSGADEIGVKIAGYAAPTIRSNTIRRNGPVAVASIELSSPAITGNRIGNAEVGIQVIDGAAPSVVGNTFTDIASVSALFLGAVGGSFDGNICPDGVGVIAFGGTTTEIGDNDCEVSSGF